jgi:hypothetical protein
MKKLLLALMIAVTIFGTTAYVSAQGEEAIKPEKGMVIGTAIELAMYAMKGDVEGDNLSAAKTRAEQGFPVGIIDEETDSLWVCVYRDPAPASHLETANKHLAPLIGQKVVSQGLMYKTKYYNLIRMSIVSEY